MILSEMVEQMEVNVEPKYFINEDTDSDETYNDGNDPLEVNATDIPDEKQKCVYCFELYDKEHAATHLKTHYGKKRHKCVWKKADGSQCGKVFKRLEHLQRHNRTHDGLKLHKCQDCSKTFSRSDHLKKHMLIHLGIKPYICEVCDKAFGRIDHLRKHIRTHPMTTNLIEESDSRKGGKVLKASQVLGLADGD